MRLRELKKKADRIIPVKPWDEKRQLCRKQRTKRCPVCIPDTLYWPAKETNTAEIYPIGYGRFGVAAFDIRVMVLANLYRKSGTVTPDLPEIF